MSREPYTQFKFNLPNALRERIEIAADRERRSLSGQIIAALERVYPEPDPFSENLRLVQKLGRKLARTPKGSESRVKAEEELRYVLQQLGEAAPNVGPREEEMYDGRQPFLFDAGPDD